MSASRFRPARHTAGIALVVGECGDEMDLPTTRDAGLA